jgi:dATP/dGTP diphosphohydrolase
MSKCQPVWTASVSHGDYWRRECSEHGLYQSLDREAFCPLCRPDLINNLNRTRAIPRATARFMTIAEHEYLRVPFTAEGPARKESPMARGVLDYFPNALMEVAHVSFVGNQQHNLGQEMHWAREKSTDHADCIMRHLAERGTLDSDGLRHSAKVAWRALALLQTEIEKASADASASGRSNS